MVYWNLENAQSGTRSFHLHLQIPAISLLAHVQFRERVAANRAKRTHVGVTNAVKQSHDQSGTSPGQNLLEVHAARFTLATRARADHEIMGPTHDWINKLIHQRKGEINYQRNKIGQGECDWSRGNFQVELESVKK